MNLCSLPDVLHDASCASRSVFILILSFRRHNARSGASCLRGCGIRPTSRLMMIAAAFLVLLRPYSVQCVLLLLLLLLGTIATILFLCCWHRRIRDGKHPIKSVLSGRTRSRGEWRRPAASHVLTLHLLHICFTFMKSVTCPFLQIRLYSVYIGETKPRSVGFV